MDKIESSLQGNLYRREGNDTACAVINQHALPGLNGSATLSLLFLTIREKLKVWNSVNCSELCKKGKHTNVFFHGSKLSLGN